MSMDSGKSREKLVAELEAARQRVAELEADSGRNQIEEALRESEERYRAQPGALSFPEPLTQKWQKIVDILAEVAQIPAALIMRVHEDTIEVFRASVSEGNPYEPGATEQYYERCGLYCEHVLRTNVPLLVPNALADKDWKDNPDVCLGMIAYLGVPILRPDGGPFGTICALDNRPNPFSPLAIRLLTQFKDSIEQDLEFFQLQHSLERRVEERTVELKTRGGQLEREILERKRTEEALRAAKTQAEAASLAKSQFLANMSHEIRTPLNGVLGMMQILQESPLDDEQRVCLDAALNSGRSLIRIISDILDLSRIESGKMEIREEEFEISGVMWAIQGAFMSEIARKGLTVAFRFDPALPAVVKGDSGRLRQILFNIVGNSIKFTEQGGVDVRVYSRGMEKGSAVLISVWMCPIRGSAFPRGNSPRSSSLSLRRIGPTPESTAAPASALPSSRGFWT